MKLRIVRGLLLGLILLPAAIATARSHAAERLNVLFIAVDDLRPALACYGDRTAVTPHIDALARRGTLFQHAYCQEAVCSPSRLSLLTGLRPDTTRAWDLSTHFRDALPDHVTLPQHFKQHGYDTRSIGKIFHGSGAPAKDPPSWSRKPLFDVERGADTRYALPENLAGTGLKRAASEAAEVPDDTYIDGIVCTAAIDALREYARGSQSFFLAVGFRKPHLPFCAPKKYWDLYEREEIPPPATSKPPAGAPEYAIRSWQELEGYSDIPADGSLSPEKVQELRHGYYACVSYIDAQVGKLLTELERLQLSGETVVVLWGDHGFHLGEQSLWTKANNYELSIRVPLIVSSPGQRIRGASCEGFVELVDLYPTLADVCGLPVPGDLEGISFRPLLDTPDRQWKTAAFSQYPRDRTSHRHQSHGDIMGYAIRTPRYRYVEWRDWESRKVLARELYDHETDPQEMRNLADEAKLAGVVRELSDRLDRGWQAALPEQE